MAAVPITSKNSAAPLAPAKIALATSGDTLAYTPDQGQELWLYNTSGSSVAVVCDGADGTTVAITGAAGATFSVASGLSITVAPNSFALVALDKAKLYLQGIVSISAATGAVVMASIVTPY